MSKSIFDARHTELVRILTEKRREVRMTQEDLARHMSRRQSFIARLERGDRRIDVVDLIKFSEVLSFDPIEVLKDLLTIKVEDL